MNTTSNKWFWGYIAILLLAIIAYFVYDNTKLKIYIHPTYRDGHAACQEAIKKRGAEFEKAILRRRERVPALADNLVSWSGKWQAIKTWGDEKAVNAWVEQQVEKSLYNPTENQQLLLKSTAAMVADWQQIENEMALKLGHPVVGKTKKSAPIKVDNIPIPPGMNHEIWKQLMYEIAANLGGEIAATFATQMAVSSGLVTVSASLGPATVGISVVAGVIVAWIVEKITDPSPKIEKELNTQLEKNAKLMRSKFEDMMCQVLKKRVNEWK